MADRRQVRTYTVRSSIDPAFRRVIVKLPPYVADALDDVSTEVSGRVAELIRAAAEGDSAQMRMVAPSIKAVKRGYPGIQVGGRARIPGRRARFSDVFFGANFGSHQHRQFRKPRKGGDYVVFQVLHGQTGWMVQTYQTAVEDAEQAVLGQLDVDSWEDL